LCEKACTCSLYDAPVTVRDNEYAIIEYGFAHHLMQPQPPEFRSNKKIAVVGSGPAGLACADLLNKRGHNVTVFERSDRAGGLLMYGIPNMKLEKSVIQRRTELMEQEGVVFCLNTAVGTDISAQTMLQDYDAVVLACGASKARDISVSGRDAKGIYFAVDFLTSTTKALLSGGLTEENHLSAKGKNVIVIGGGDTGNDCVGTSIRHGCKSIIQLEMMPPLPEKRTEDNPFPQYPRIRKTDYGQEEAIAVFGSDPRRYCTTVKEFCKDENGALCAVKTVRLAFDANRHPHEIEGSEEILPCELCLIAAGFVGCEAQMAEKFGVTLDERGNLQTVSGTHQTQVKNLFTAGDMHIGQSLVVRAIREGRDTAAEVDSFLMGYTNLTGRC
ncbi:MAG: glutamate synthase subunit beta, partial [Oscillospiraceae bacterium]|nr:glutamate synthase subunit beta [Oscillospiraceae bacterium]